MKQLFIFSLPFLFIGCGGGGSDSDSDLISSLTPTTTPNLNAIDITNVIFTKRSFDCADYDENYRSAVRDLTRVINFDGDISIIDGDQSCTLSSDNIPNHDFNDSTAFFRTNAIEIERDFVINRYPEIVSQNTDLDGNTWDAVMLNGVVADVRSGGCYLPSESRADVDGNTEAGCTPNANWRLVPLEYSTKFGADTHNAHVQPDGSYHYHGNPNAMFDDTPSGDGSPLIGFAADGFPIYGSYILDSSAGTYRKVKSGYTLKQGLRGTKSDINPGGNHTGVYEEDWEWTDAGDLDECNGMTYKDHYGYYVTDTYPYILNCLKGTPDPSFSK